MNKALFSDDERRQVFQQMEIAEARAHSMAGGIAIHLHRFIGPRAPQCFKRAIAKGESIAHVFGQDRAELERIARSVGINVVVIEKEGTPSQHFDACGTPLKRLLESVR